MSSGLQAAGISCLPAGNKQGWGMGSGAGSSHTLLQFRAVNESHKLVFFSRTPRGCFLLEKTA